MKRKLASTAFPRLENSFAELPGVFFSKLSPTPVREPELVLYNEILAEEIGLDLSGLSGKELCLLYTSPSP